MVSTTLRIVITLVEHFRPDPVQKQILILLIVGALGFSACTTPAELYNPPVFDSRRAFQDLEFQVALGPRISGSQAHEGVRQWLNKTLADLGWEVENQSVDYSGQEIHNIIGKREIGEEYPWVILGAHYDSRLIADRDPTIENRTQPVPGANDGASGVAVLTELARVIPTDLQANVWIVFFDAEDNGNIPGYQWILGSRAFVENLESFPDTVVIVDMVGDKDLNIYIEKNSSEHLVREIWEIAASLGYGDHFINQPKHSIIDDHLPFIQAGIPAIDIIDFDYPYWHTISDTVDKVSSKSLGIVGEVVLNWLIMKYGGS